jgi:xylulokinase
MPGFYVGVDSGTQGTKTVVVDAEGRVRGSASVSYGLIEGLPRGHMEQHPETWVDAMKRTIRGAVKDAGVDPDKVRAVGVSGQQHGFVPLDGCGAVIRPAKLWNDTSTAKECSELTEALGGVDEVIRLTGNSIPPGFTAGKILWLRRREPDNYAKLRRVLLPHDYLNYVLTGEASMEYGDASGTALMDVRRREWCRDVIDAIDPELIEWLPELRPSDRPAGVIMRSIASELGLGDDVLVSAGGGDNMMGAIGTGNTSPGKVTVSLGTSGTVYAYSDAPVVDPGGEVAAFCDSTNGWLPLVCTMNVTVATELTRGLLGLSHTELEKIVSEAPPGCDGLLLLPYLTGERVPNVPHGKGVLYGLTPASFEAGHLARAAMEGATMGLNYGLNRMRELGIDPLEIRLTGGGARNRAWRRIAADVFDAEIVTLKEEEGAAYGAALQALWTYRLQQGERVIMSEITDELVEIDEPRRLKPIRRNVETYGRLQSTQDRLSIDLRGLFDDSSG